MLQSEISTESSENPRTQGETEVLLDGSSIMPEWLWFVRCLFSDQRATSDSVRYPQENGGPR